MSLSAPVIVIQARPSFPELPEDIHLLVFSYLDSWDLLCCQRVSWTWRKIFQDLELMRFMLKKHKSCREVRQLESQPFSGTSASDPDWQAIFNTVAARYSHLKQGKARKVVKYKLEACEQIGYWYPIGQFDFHESQPGGRLYHEHAATHLSSLGDKPYLFRQTLWSYEDGLLVFPPSLGQFTTEGHILSLLDIETDTLYPIPFSIHRKMIRNLRLRSRTLVIEWCERDPFHNLTAMEQVNRHFATCFDIRRNPTSRSWDIIFRCEWKLHFLGLPLTTRDRFFSTHTSTHYCVYFWQPNRSMYTGDEENPIENLVVWDISDYSPYRPSQDPTGKNRPSERNGAQALNHFSFHVLDFLGVRQHSNISLMSLHLDELNITVRENMCVAGQGYFDPAERLWNARTTTFPMISHTPTVVRNMDGDLPPYRGHCSMESTDVEESERWFLPVMDVYDELADVRWSLIETCFTGASAQNRVMLRVKLMGECVTVSDEVVNEVGGMGRIAGDERWVIGQNRSMELVIAKF